MNWLEAAFLGLVQGLTEFLPVSSSGHLVIAETLLGQSNEGIAFEVAVHVGTLLAILIYYRARVAALIVGTAKREPESLRYVGKLVLATLPAVLVGLTVKDQIEGMFEHAWIAGVALLATGCLLLTTRHSIQTATLAQPTWSHALIIGCAQVVAITPGMSRSGTTVAVALLLGIRALAATEFSFLMGVAAIAGAAVLQLPELMDASNESLVAYGVGAGVAAVAGLAAIILFVRLLRSQKFHVFAWYCFAAGGSFLAYLALR
jgi:undecaprenyl-diphosphatase